MADSTKKPTPNPAGEESLGFTSEPAEATGMDRRRLLSLSLGAAAAGYAAPKVVAAASADSGKNTGAENVAVALPFDDVLSFVDQRGTLDTKTGNCEYVFHGSCRITIDGYGNVQITQLSLTGNALSGEDLGQIQLSQSEPGLGSYGSADRPTDLIASMPVTYKDDLGSAAAVAHTTGFVAAGRSSLDVRVDVYGRPGSADVGIGIGWGRRF